ncbi:MAG: 1-acyl-sn-glycerol-3-phosphate acyltransferase [Firmicutes bacterium]|nr:1-acyl-sn-glycerol-3-phosphate acyltransferase [Bacillota bacterium]
MKIIGSLLWLVLTIFALTLALLLLPVVWLLKLLGIESTRRRVAHGFAHWWGRFVFRASGSKVRVHGLDKLPPGPVVVMGNHQGIFDIMLVMGFIPKPLAFIAKKELTKMPLISTWMRNIGCLFLDRKDVRQAVAVINTGVQQLKDGTSMVIFPEGTRSRSSEMLPFRQGSMKLAVRAGVPIVPVSIKGTYGIYEQNRLIAPARVILWISEPVLPAEFGSKTGELSNLVRQRIEDGLKQISAQ